MQANGGRGRGYEHDLSDLLLLAAICKAMQVGCYGLLWVVMGGYGWLWVVMGDGNRGVQWLQRGEGLIVS